MDGLAAEIAQEVGVLFQHDHVDPTAGEHQAQHHPGRSAAGDADPGRDGHRSLSCPWMPPNHGFSRDQPRLRRRASQTSRMAAADVAV